MHYTIFRFFVILFFQLFLVHSNNVFACNVDAINAIESYLNSLNKMQASFTQIDSDGAEKYGQIYLAKPDRLKWEYLGPQHQLILINKDLMMYHDYELRETNTISSKSVIIHFLLQNKINFKKDVQVKRCEESNNWYDIIFTRKNLHIGYNFDLNLWLRFKKRPIALAFISTIDVDDHIVSKIKLEEIRYNVIFDENEFVFKNIK